MNACVCVCMCVYVCAHYECLRVCMCVSHVYLVREHEEGKGAVGHGEKEPTGRGRPNLVRHGGQGGRQRHAGTQRSHGGVGDKLQRAGHTGARDAYLRGREPG